MRYVHMNSFRTMYIISSLRFINYLFVIELFLYHINLVFQLIYAHINLINLLNYIRNLFALKKIGWQEYYYIYIFHV